MFDLTYVIFAATIVSFALFQINMRLASPVLAASPASGRPPIATIAATTAITANARIARARVRRDICNETSDRSKTVAHAPAVDFKGPV